jgi:hypothetical protein
VTVVVDASVALKWVIEEDRSEAARELLLSEVLAVETRQIIPSGAYLDRDCFVAVLLAMTSTYAVIASEEKQSRRGPAREQASGLHH